MKNILFLICALSLFSVLFVSTTHAYVDDDQGLSQQIELSVDHDNQDSDSTIDTLCGMHCHNHIDSADFVQADFLKTESKLLSALFENITPFPIYGLKRPPRF